MKIIDTYNIYKEKYREYVVLIKSGIFYSVYNDDVSIIYSLFHYKIKNVGNNFNIGFPISNINNVCNKLVNKKINYIILEKENDNYEVIEKQKFNKNNYNNYKVDLSKLSYLNNRINNIVNKLNNKVLDKNIDEILFKIEELI